MGWYTQQVRKLSKDQVYGKHLKIKEYGSTFELCRALKGPQFLECKGDHDATCTQRAYQYKVTVLQHWNSVERIQLHMDNTLGPVEVQ